MPGVVILVRDEDLRKRFDNDEERKKVQEFIHATLSEENSLRTGVITNLVFDWVYPNHSSASADIMFQIPFSIRPGGLVPQQRGEASFTKDESTRIKNLLKEKFLAESVVAVWLVPWINAGYSES